MNIQFDIDNFQKWKSVSSNWPQVYWPYFSICKKKYSIFDKEYLNKKYNLKSTFVKIRERFDASTYYEIYPALHFALSYSQKAFPFFRFILPEVLTDDWLSIVDWHKFQRDHVLHQLLSVYITHELLNKLDINGVKLIDKCVDKILEWNGTYYIQEYLKKLCYLKRDFNKLPYWINDNNASKLLWKWLFMETAFIAAVFHDIGYPWQYLNVLNSKLESYNHSKEIIFFNASELIKSYGNRLFFYPLNGYSQINLNAPANWFEELTELTHLSLSQTHGFPGTVNFIRLNDILKEYPNNKMSPIRQFCIEWAAMAIMMHDMEKIYWGNDKNTPQNKQLKLDFNIDPLSCVIALSDILQDFCRPCAKFYSKTNKVILEYNNSCSQTMIGFKDGCLTIEYFFEKKHLLLEKKLFLPDEEKKFFDSENGYINLSGLGISEVKMIAKPAKKSGPVR